MSTITTADGSPLPQSIPAATYQRDILSAASGFMTATGIAREALLAIGASLQKGMHHSRPMLEDTFKRLAPRLKGCTMLGQEAGHINSSQRLFDLVRHQRAELHDAELITDEEYSWLCGGSPMATSPEGGSPSRERLEEYDEMRERTTLLQRAVSFTLEHHSEDPEECLEKLRIAARHTKP